MSTGPSAGDVKNAGALNDLFKSMQDITGDIQRNLENIKEEESAILSTQDRGVKIAQQKRQLLKEEERLIKNKSKFSASEFQERIKSLKTAGDQLALAEKISKQNVKIRNGLISVNDQAKKITGNLEKFVEALPGGAALSKMFGVHTLGARFEDALNQAGQAFKDSGGSVNAAMKAFGGGLKGLLGPGLILVAALGGLVALFVKISKEAKQLALDTGLTYSQSKLLAKESRAITTSLDASLSSSQDILTVQKETIAQFGLGSMLTAEQAMNVSEIGKSFGYGAGQAAKVNNAFMQMGATAGTAAKAQRDLAAEALKAGVNVGAVTKDIADNAKATSKYFGGNVKALKKAAISAAKMGMSISTMAKVADGLLNIEESIAAQFELQAMTGKQVNFDLARQLALEGDIAGATKSIMDQIGTSADFAKMNVVQREALAKATGMDVNELQKSMIIQEKLGSLTAEQTAAMSNLGLSASEMASMSSEELQNRLAAQQANEKASQAFTAMGNTLMNALQPAAEAIMEIFGALAPILKVAFAPIEMAAKGLGYILGLANEYKGVVYTIGGILAANYLNTKLTAALEASKTAGSMYQLGLEKGMLAIDYLRNSQLGIMLGLSQAKLAVSTADNAQKKRGILLMGAEIVKGALMGALNLAKAIGGIFSSFSQIPFGIGIPLAAIAVGGLFAMFAKAKSKKTGDLGIDPNGGPIVSSPKVGGIFQGAKADGVSMGPGMGTDPSISSGGGGGATGVMPTAAAIGMAVAKALQGVQLSTPNIQIGGQVIEAIGDQLDELGTFKAGIR
jgi:hypothetical protein